MIEKKQLSLVRLALELRKRLRSAKGGSWKAIRTKLTRAVRQVSARFGIRLPGPVGIKTWGELPRKIIDKKRTHLVKESCRAWPHPHPHLCANSLEYPETGVAELSEATVYGPTVGVVDKENHLIPEVSIQWGTPSELHWTLRRLILPRRETLRGQTLLLASTGGETYFHWMTDVLPRIKLILMAGYQLAQFDHILVTGINKPFQKETFAAAGIPLNKCRILGPKAKGYFCENLTLPSLPSTPGIVPRSTVDYLKELFPAERSSAKRKIFVGRADAKHRILQHESEIRRQLALRGFETYESEGASVAEQARLFHSAETIVAAHGAALTNLVFCEPGTTVLELFSPKYVNPCYRDTCVAANLNYAAVIGDGKDWEVVMEHDQPASPISTSTEATLEALAQMVAR